MEPLAQYDTIQTGEMHDFARVLKAALGMVVAHWNVAQKYPPAHPYRQAVRMVSSYLERRYGV